MPVAAEVYNVTLYKTAAIHVMQSEGFHLLNTTRVASETKGKTVEWWTVGGMKMSDLAPGMSKSAASNPEAGKITANFLKKEANWFVKEADEAEIPMSLQSEFQIAAGKAIGRQFDELVIGGMEADIGSIEVIGNGGATINPNHAEAARNAIAKTGQAGLEYYCALPLNFLSQLRQYKMFSNADYIKSTPLMESIQAVRWGGISFIPMPDDFFAAPGAGRLRAYMWAKTAVGFEWSRQWKHRVDWLPQEKGWFGANDMSCVSKVLLPAGVKALDFANTAVDRVPELI